MSGNREAAVAGTGPPVGESREADVVVVGAGPPVGESRETDVVVVGAGPAGSVAAAALAASGLRTVLVGDGSGHGRQYDVVLSAVALDGLAAIPGADAAPLRRLNAADLAFGAGSPRELADAPMAVFARDRLDSWLHGLAEANGAEPLTGRVVAVEGDRVLVRQGQRAMTITAGHVVLATGCERPGIARTPVAGALPSGVVSTLAGGVACARRYRGVRLDGRLSLRLAVPPRTDARARPACLWIVPGDGDTCTIGLARIGDGTDCEEAHDRAVAELMRRDDRFAAATPAGPPVTGPVSSAFAPARTVEGGCLRVGDAAGLANPFTGEGLSHTVHSALYAAEAIAAHPDDPAAARDAYARRLSATFVGYFETARHAAHRYHLAWRMLEATSGSDSPLFVKGRRAVLLPEGLAGATMADQIELPEADALALAPFLAACDEVALAAVREEWPFIARLLLAGRGPGEARIRPAVLFVAALAAAGGVPQAAQVTVGSAVELAMLGALAFLGPGRPAEHTGRGVDWGTTTTVLVGDFLLAQATRLVSAEAPDVAWSFADWLTELTCLRGGRLTDPPGVTAADVFAAMFEFPARLGAQLGCGSPALVARLRAFGRHCGTAFLLADDILALRGQRNRLDTTPETAITARISAIPHLLGRPGHGLADEERARAVEAAVAECRRVREAALALLPGVPGELSRRVLRAFVDAITAPA
ncbi:FAD-dependent oxidoreductase [Nonomuraea sp. NPDC000554]|uniref:FAD-dependent oxidoreductase n=1 Tax=Nonomuraea sp. NPDC000554 TaxID=3154259 RepID=UPI003332FBF6